MKQLRGLTIGTGRLVMGGQRECPGGDTGKKTGKDKRFYDEMIPVADRELSAHLEDLKRGN